MNQNININIKSKSENKGIFSVIRLFFKKSSSNKILDEEQCENLLGTQQALRELQPANNLRNKTIETISDKNRKKLLLPAIFQSLKHNKTIDTNMCGTIANKKESKKESNKESKKESNKESNKESSYKNFICKNISTNLANKINISPNPISPSISRHYLPPPNYGLENSERIFGSYYLTDINLVGKIFEIDFFKTIVDDIRNTRKLNRFQKDFLKTLTSEQKDILIEEYRIGMEHLIDFIDNAIDKS